MKKKPGIKAAGTDPVLSISHCTITGIPESAARVHMEGIQALAAACEANARAIQAIAEKARIEFYRPLIELGEIK